MLNNLKYEFSYKSNSFKIVQNKNSFYAIVIFFFSKGGKKMIWKILIGIRFIESN